MINLLKLYDPILQKVRIGNQHDGGYVVPLQSIARSKALFSYGVGTDVSFEKAYIDSTENAVFCYDHTIESFVNVDEPYNSKITYFKEGLSGIKTENTNNFLEHYEQSKIQERVLLKADVEGAEFEFILNTDIKRLAEVTTGLIFEFHYIQDPSRKDNAFKCLEKLNEYYYLCHLHGNNYASSFVYEELQPNNYIKTYLVPEVLELTFVNKDLVPYELVDKKSYPCTFLDRPNDLSKLEHDLTFLKFL